jgi:hypothetical protein
MVPDEVKVKWKVSPLTENRSKRSGKATSESLPASARCPASTVKSAVDAERLEAEQDRIEHTLGFDESADAVLRKWSGVA